MSGEQRGRGRSKKKHLERAKESQSGQYQSREVQARHIPPAPRGVRGRGREPRVEERSGPSGEGRSEPSFEGRGGPSFEGRGGPSFEGRSGPSGEGRSAPRFEERGQGEGSGSMKRRQAFDDQSERAGEPVTEKKFQSSSEGGDAGSSGGMAAEPSTSQGPGGDRREMRHVLETKPSSCATKRGSTGSLVKLTTNYFDVESIPNWVLYQYQVIFSVDETRERVKRAWLFKHKDAAIKSAFIFDGNHLYTSKRLTDKFPDVLKLQTMSKEETLVHIEIKFLQELRRGHGAYLQVFNVLIRRCLFSLNLQLVQRNYFDPSASVPLPQHYLEIWPGYVTSLRQHDGGIMMCTKVTHKVMRTDTAFQVLRDCTNSPDYKRAFQQAMIGAVVLTEYTNKTYQIGDVDFSQNPTSTFMFKDRKISFVDYYKERYNIKIHDLQQPLLATRRVDRGRKGAGEGQSTTREILLIPELCRMTGLSPRMVDNKPLMKDMANITRVSPEQRIQRLEAFNKRLHSNVQVLHDFRDWGLEVSRHLKTIEGRILPSETILAGSGKSFGAGRDCDWIVPLRSSPMFSPGGIYRWVFITSHSVRNTVERFLPTLKKAADGMRIRLPAPIVMTTRSENASEIVDLIERALAMHNPDFIAFGFSNDRADRYAAVKRKCCVDRGVSSQVILLRSMTSKGVMSIATKIAIQIHTKAGGVPWSIHIPSDSCMVVGFDVCHDSMSKSVGAMVASTSPNMSTWYSSVNQHSSREEISFFLAGDIHKALLKYLDKNKTLPGKLIVYRDGVGEGQLAHVLEHEVNVLKEKLTNLYRGETWKMAYVIVTKRIHTRFFMSKQNPVPGTVVDDEVTLPERYDFYLVSQSVRQGTVTPTQYNIISDNLGWSPDIMQRFTYKLTYLYYNSSSPVQVPAPCQYAHKLAFLTNQTLHSSHHPNLEDKLFFL